jgi:iron complex outermembrane recepter protein
MKTWLLASACAATVLHSTTTHAQERSDSTADLSSTLETVLVTAQKRSENILDVPIAISVLDADSLAATGGNTLQSIQGRVPGMFISNGGAYGASPIGIRGATGVSTTFGDDPVAIYVDGVYRARGGFFGVSGLLDVETIEIVRGPQGTLQGRNATAGAVLVRTADPETTLGGYVKVQVSDPEAYKIESALTGPLSETLSARLAVSYVDDKGWAKNTFNGKDLETVKDKQARLTLLWTPGDVFNLRVSADFDRAETANAVARWAATAFNPSATGPLVTAPTPTVPLTPAERARVEDDYDFSLNHSTDAENEQKNASVQATWDFGSLQLAAITGWGDMELSGSSDSDGFARTDREGFNDSVRNSRSYSQELRLQSDGEAVLSWILGLYYFHEDQDMVFDIYNLAYGPSATRTYRRFIADQKTDSYASFADATWRPSEQWALSAGARYTEDRKEFDLNARSFNEANQPATPAQIFMPPEAGWDDVSYRAKLAYTPADDWLLYLSYGKGFKAGGYNAFGAEAAFDPEELVSWEVGLKASFPQAGASIAAAVYVNTYDSLQIRAGVPSGGVAIINAADSSIEGFEIEGMIQPLDALRLKANLAYTDATFDAFPRAIDVAGAIVDASGNRLPRVPEWQYFVSAAYDVQFGGDWIWTSEVTYSWRDTLYHLHTDQSSPAWQGEPLGELGARLTFNHDRSGVRFGAYGTNLTDDRSVTNAGNTFNYPLASFNRPRTAGVFVEKTF